MHVKPATPTEPAKAKDLWIGLIEVRPLEGSRVLEGDRGAFVNVVTWASDAEEYTRKADLVLAQLGLFMVEVENPEPVTIRRGKAALEADVEDMVTRAQDNPNAIIYGTFHIWKRDTG